MSSRRPRRVANQSSVFHFSHHSIGLGDRLVNVGELIFRDDSTRNSFRLETSRELFRMLPEIEKNCDALLFRSEGRVFCSGGNLKDHLELGPIKGKQANREITQCLTRLSALSIPSVAVVEGDVFGGGHELLSAFDVVVATPHVVFGLWQRRLGLSFGWGGGARLQRLMSSAKLSRMALQSRPMTADEALSAGFVDHVATPWSARADGLAVALRLASLPQAPVRTMKNLKAVPAAEARREQQAFEKLWFGPEHKARLKAFSAKSAKSSR